MKKFMIFLATMLVSFFAFSQIKQEVSPSITMNYYAGILSTSSFTVDKLAGASHVGVRFGGFGTYKISPKIHLTSMGFIDQSTGGIPSGATHFFLTGKLNLFNFSFGKISTIVTEHRPYPPTGDGQFETWTHSQLMGANPGVKFFKGIGSSIKIGGGIFFVNQKPNYQATFRFKESVKISGYYGFNKEKFGIVASVKSQKISNTIVYKKDIILANIFCYNFQNDLTLYLDCGTEDKKFKKIPRFELGILKNFSSDYLSGLTGLGISHDKPYDKALVKGYLFLHL